jgi:hypothetical protein
MLGDRATSAGGGLGGSEWKTANADLASRFRLAPERCVSASVDPIAAAPAAANTKSLVERDLVVGCSSRPSS